MKGTEVVGCRLLEASCQGTEALEFVKEDLDQIALGVGLLVQTRLLLARGVWADDGLHAAAADIVTNGVGVVAGVGDYRLALRMFDEFVGDRGLVLLPRRDLDVERPAERVDDRVEFRGESTT